MYEVYSERIRYHHFSLLALFFVIRLEVSSRVITIWLNNRFHRCFHSLKESWNLVSGMAFSALPVFVSTIPLSMNWCRLIVISVLETAKSRRNLCRGCTEAGETVRQLLHMVRWMRWCVIMVTKPIIAWPFFSKCITHLLRYQYFLLIVWS